MSIFRKTLETDTIPALVISTIYGIIMYFYSTTPLLDGIAFFAGYMGSSLVIAKIKSNPDKKKVNRNMLIYSLSIVGVFVLLVTLLTII